MTDKLTNKEKADVKRRFKKWLKYEPVINVKDVHAGHIEEYVTNVLTINYFNKESLVKEFLTETFLN